MVATSKSHFTGSTVASEYRAKDTHLINLEYYNASLLMENSLELRDDRPQIFGQHPHGLWLRPTPLAGFCDAHAEAFRATGVYALHQLFYMATSRKNFLYRKFPYLVDQVIPSVAGFPAVPVRWIEPVLIRLYNGSLNRFWLRGWSGTTAEGTVDRDCPWGLGSRFVSLAQIRSTGASVVFYMPFVREIFLYAGHGPPPPAIGPLPWNITCHAAELCLRWAISTEKASESCAPAAVVVSRPTLEKVLSKGQSLGIVVGGEEECLLTENGKDRVVLGGRKGFVKLALKHGTRPPPPSY